MWFGDGFGVVEWFLWWFFAVWATKILLILKYKFTSGVDWHLSTVGRHPPCCNEFWFLVFYYYRWTTVTSENTLTNLEHLAPTLLLTMNSLCMTMVKERGPKYATWLVGNCKEWSLQRQVRLHKNIREMGWVWHALDVRIEPTKFNIHKTLFFYS